MANKPWLRTRAHFLTAGDEAELRTLTTGQRGRLTHYRIREVLPVRGEAPVALVDGWRMVRIETPTPFSLSEDLLLPDGSSVLQFHGVTQHLQYTSQVQREELNEHSRPELEPTGHTTAVLIPIGKSVEWWKLALDQRQAYFEQTQAAAGHIGIGLKYADRVFRQLYHSHSFHAALSYDFLTYFEFQDTDEQVFRALLAELRDPRANPEWAYITLEYEIWMTKIG
ncbi:MAG: hypothetical protein AUF64_01915 [Chloroflexi bacterium 13_1_20CM_54_36]|jgi:hypothetical protein|nr:MAG: hypothetical protein AUH05_13915 [Ktedonobacter sp. 13_2_20CM_53_11]OLB57309.1 MAG: hypothetical protein AUI01_04850 [Ktedonobacter sp. 13_2_20CM_2_56_8]OLD84370.1 MAG: hypothetical protein AUF64_01915 [Chloroflexi bacterium 13_1_20CM_54_36]OLE33966.1 MAG: hypothetical protein AUG45_05870 [Ktedonobacter sp. 13_1_20CM_3_54_15]